MFTGYNCEVEHDGQAFHVQTEDKGLDNPVVETRVYRGGQVVASVLTSYADLADSPDYTHDRIQRRMQEQHQSLIEDLRGGRLEAEPKVRLKALSRILDPDNLVEEFVEDWIEASNAIAPVHQALERDVDEIRAREVDALSRKKSKKAKRTRSNLALLVVLISIGAAFELGRVSQRSTETAAQPTPVAQRQASVPLIPAPVLELLPQAPEETELPPVAPQPSVSAPAVAPKEPSMEETPKKVSPTMEERQPVVQVAQPQPEQVSAEPIATIEELHPVVNAPVVEAPAVAAEPPPPLVGPFEMDEVDQAPTSIATQLPVYTEAALRAAREGSVRLKVLVGTDGSIDAVRMLDEITDSDLNKAAISAILHWRFNPGSHQGQPVSVWVPVRLDFSLSKNQMRSVVRITR